MTKPKQEIRLHAYIAQGGKPKQKQTTKGTIKKK